MTKSYGKIYQNKLNVSIDATDLYNVWPVGSVYISVTDINPSEYFGGTWIAFGTGRCLVGVDTSQSEFNTVMKTGGEKSHLLTLSEIPNHNHDLVLSASGAYVGGNRVVMSNWYWSENSQRISNSILEAGGGQTHNNLQPYITVYMWRRTA